jgi:hypothetical protein
MLVMKNYKVPARTLLRIKVANTRQYYKWNRDETSSEPKTNISVKDNLIIATNFTQKPATLTLSEDY